MNNIDDLMKLGSVMDESTDTVITTGDIRKGKCQYYSEISMSCSLATCRHGHMFIDEDKIPRCDTSGVIDDLYREDIPVHNYFKSRGKL